MVEIRGECGGERNGGELQAADEELMSPRLASDETLLEGFEQRAGGDLPEHVEAARAELRAGAAEFRAEFPGVDFSVERAEFVEVRARGGGAGKAEIREFLLDECGENLLLQESAQAGFVADDFQPDQLFQTERMGVGTSREKRVAGLENEGEPGLILDFRIWILD